MALRRLDSLGYQIGLLSRLFDKGLQEALQPLGVAPGQFAPLVMLFEQDGLTQAELCRRINVEQPTMANTLDRMERDGLIKRKPDPDDKRRAAIHLTPRARDIKAEVMDKVRLVANRAVTGLSPAEQDQFFQLVGRIVDNFNPR